MCLCVCLSVFPSHDSRGVRFPSISSHFNYNSAVSGGANKQLMGEFDFNHLSDLALLFSESALEDSTYPGTANSGPDQSLFLHGVDVELMFKNDTNQILVLSLMTVRPRRDSTSSCLGLYGNLAAQFLADATPSATDTTPGFKLFESKAVRDFYTLLKTQRVYLRPGQVHVHHMHYTINRRLDKFMTLNPATPYYRDFYVGLVYSVVGTPVADGSSGATFGATSVLVTVSRVVKFEYLNNNKPCLDITDVNLDTVATNSGLNFATAAVEGYAAVH